MSIVKVLRDDPNGTVGDSVMFLVVALVGVVVAVLIFRPLFSGERESVPAARPS